MDIQYKELFKNSSVRHLIAKVQLSDLSGQLNNLVNLNLVNFFVLAKTVNIDQVLAAAERSNYFGKKYSWCLITKVLITTHNWIFIRNEYPIVINYYNRKSD